MPSPVDKYVKQVRESNPDYSDAQVWATAWSIYCKHKNPGSEHCKKPTSEYLKNKGKSAMAMDDEIALRVAAQSTVNPSLADRVASRHRHALTIGNTFETEMWRIHRFNDSLKITHLENAGKRGKKCPVFSLGFSYLKGNSLKDSVGLELTTLAKKNVTLNAMEKALQDIMEDFQGTLPFGGSLHLDRMEYRGVDVMPGGFEQVKLDGKYVEIEAGYDDFVIRDKVDKNNLPTCIPAVKGGKKSIPVFYRWVKDNEKKLKNMKFYEVISEMGDLGIDSHQFCAMD